jgi:hypothetical protein
MTDRSSADVTTGRCDGRRAATVERVLRGPGATSPELRQAVASGAPPVELAALVDKLRGAAWTVTDADLDALRGTYDEDALFELVVATSIGAAEARLQAARRALEAACDSNG